MDRRRFFQSIGLGMVVAHLGFNSKPPPVPIDSLNQNSLPILPPLETYENPGKEIPGEIGKILKGIIVELPVNSVKQLPKRAEVGTCIYVENQAHFVVASHNHWAWLEV